MGDLVFNVVTFLALAASIGVFWVLVRLIREK